MPLLNNVKVLFSNVLNIDDFSKKYQLVVDMTEEQAADAEAAGVRIRNKEYEGKAQFQATFKTQFRPPVVDPAKNPQDLGGAEIGRGSLVNIQYSFRDWVSPDKTKKGTATDLAGVQVLKLQAGAGGEFEEVAVGDTDDGSEF